MVPEKMITMAIQLGLDRARVDVVHIQAGPCTFWTLSNPRSTLDSFEKLFVILAFGKSMIHAGLQSAHRCLVTRTIQHGRVNTTV